MKKLSLLSFLLCVLVLVIAATEEGAGNYCSAKLMTQDSHNFRYGRIILIHI